MTPARFACLLMLLPVLLAGCGRDADAPGTAVPGKRPPAATGPAPGTEAAPGAEMPGAPALPEVTSEGLDAALAGAEAALAEGRLERDGAGAYGALDWFEAARGV